MFFRVIGMGLGDSSGQYTDHAVCDTLHLTARMIILSQDIKPTCG